MHDHSNAGHPGLAILSLVAAALGAIAHWLDGWALPGLGRLYGSFGPDDLTAWTKALSTAVFTAVNTLVGCYNLLAFARNHRRRKAAHRDTPPASGTGSDGAAGGRAGGA